MEKVRDQGLRDPPKNAEYSAHVVFLRLARFRRIQSTWRTCMFTRR